MTAVAGGLRTRDLPVGTGTGAESTLHVHEAGDPTGPPVLWLHGSGPGVSARSNWERLITELVPGFHHLAPDVLGFGDSSHPEDPPRGNDFLELRVDTLIALLDVLELPRVHVVGNSMGGLIALRMRQKAPDRFDRMVLMGSAGARTGGGPTPALMQMVGFYRDPTPAAMRDLLTSFMADTSRFADTIDDIAADRVAIATRPGVRRSHEATFDPSAGPVLSFSPEELGAMTNEVLVVHGREDQVIPIEGSYYLSTHLPNAQLHVLPHAGHWVQLEQPERFAIQARNFFAEPLR